MVERTAGDTIARLTDVRREPSQVLVTTADGEVLLRDHPVKETLTVTANLTVREASGRVLFKGEPVEPGSTVVLDLEGTTIQAEILSL